MKSHQGFTLIEIMVVVVIAAILMGAVTMSLTSNNNDRLKEEADRFSVLIELAQDEAILQSLDLALSVNDSGYSFFSRSGDSWSVFSDKPFVNRNLQSDIQAQMLLEGVAIKLSKPEKSEPQVVIYSSGEVTPFTYILSNNKNSVVTIKVDGAGNQTVTFKSNE